MKTAIVTGASRGIGKETALLLAKEYDLVGVISRNTENALLSLAREVPNLEAFVGDCADASFMEETLHALVQRTGRIDLLVNNAAISHVGLLSELTAADWQRVINTNLSSVYHTCHAVIPQMVRQKSGKIINISSVWGLYGASCEVAYSASKGGVNAFTKALAKELAPSSVSVNAIAFGAVDTEMNAQLSAEEKIALTEQIPAGRMMTAAEAAACILKLSEMPDYLTGAVLKADGGWC